ncbi:hypothetical protein LZ31DRAFT_128420 [Colletotrichum somersetense]|nr:hypothetical protein LZ31DRAFT_128420 [Colletotrichum somersetense]
MLTSPVFPMVIPLSPSLSLHIERGIASPCEESKPQHMNNPKNKGGEERGCVEVGRYVASFSFATDYKVKKERRKRPAAKKTPKTPLACPHMFRNEQKNNQVPVCPEV